MPPTRRLAALCAGLLLLAAIGCTTTPQAPQLDPLPPPAAEVPAANLPESLREWNWTDAQRSGSCVHASLVYHLRWQNQLQTADWWRRTHAGGETAQSIRQHLDRAGLRYEYTEAADPAFLIEATRNRRGAIIWYYDLHCVHFCGFTNDRGRLEAIICDNNRVERFIRIPAGEFCNNWAGYGGFALSVTGEPVSPPLAPAYQPKAPT